MPRWNIDQGRRCATLDIFDGTLTVWRDPDAGLVSRWVSPQLEDVPAGLFTRLAHVGAFAIPAAAIAGVSPEQGIAMMASKWAGGTHKTWADTPATVAFEFRLHGWTGEKDHLYDNAMHAAARAFVEPHPDGARICGAACWLAPVAVKVHLKGAYLDWYAEHGGVAQAAPDLFVADRDPF